MIWRRWWNEMDSTLSGGLLSNNRGRANRFVFPLMGKGVEIGVD
jgi:hypothetical protein